jgi:hypothetical protein
MSKEEITPSPLGGEGWGEGVAEPLLTRPLRGHPPLNPLPSRDGNAAAFSI